MNTRGTCSMLNSGSSKPLVVIVLLLASLDAPLANCQGNWPMPGHDQQKTGRANFAGPTAAPAVPDWTFPTAAPIVGDIAVSAEGKLYFASDKVYALNQDGTSYASALVNGIPATSPTVDDKRNLVFVAVSNPTGGFDILSFTKLLQNPTALLHVPSTFGGGISSLVLSNFGTLYFTAGRFPGTTYAIGPITLPDGTVNPLGLLWSNPLCQAESGASPGSSPANAPAVTSDGVLVFVMCSPAGTTPGGLFRLNAGDGTQNLQLTGPSSVSTNRGSTEPAIGTGGIYAGWQAFGGAIFCGDFLSWDATLNQLTPSSPFCDSSRFTTSRAAIFPDGHSTVRIGFAFPPNNQLDADGANQWIISTDNSTIPNFSSLPSVDAAGNVFVGNTQGIQARSAVDGHLLWSLNLADAITTQPVVANGGALYAGSDSGIVYAFNTNPKLNSGTVYVTGGGLDTVDLLSASVINKNGFDAGGAISVSPDGTRSYVSATFGLGVVDNATNQLITTVPTGIRPLWNALSPDGARAYVTNQDANTVFVVDTSTNTPIANIPVPSPLRVAVAPDNSRVYVTTRLNGIAVIDPATLTVAKFISGPGFPTGIAFTPDSAHAFVGEFVAPVLDLIDAHTDTFTGAISVPVASGAIGGVIVGPDGKKLYASSVRTGPVDPARNVYVLDTATNSLIAQIPVSFPTSQMAITSDGANLLVGDSDIGELLVVSMATDSIVETIQVNPPGSPTIAGIGAKPPRPVIVVNTGTLNVTTNNAAASFSISNGTQTMTAAGLSFVQTVPTGTYTVTFNPIPGFITPQPQMQALAPGGMISFEGIYKPIPPALVATPSSLSISYETGTGKPVTSSDLIISSTAQNLTVSLAISDPVHHNWLAVSPVNGQTPLHVSVSVAPGLKAGVYSGSLIASATGVQDLSISVTLTVTPGPNARLVFPVRTNAAHCNGVAGTCTQFNANISAVYDHDMNRAYEANAFQAKKNGPCVLLATPPAGWGRIVDFLGEAADKPDITTFSTGVCNTLHGYQGTEGLPFLQNTHYVGNPSTSLYYDAHPGYDYPFPYPVPAESLSKLTGVYPAVSGCVTYTQGAAGADAAGYHVLTIVPMNAPPNGPCTPNLSETGYIVFYLHLASYLDQQGNPVACLIPNPGHKACKKEISCTTCAKEGQWISSNTTDPIAYVGNFAHGVWGGVRPHLHFEIDKISAGTITPLDPYGWWVASPDPFGRAANTWLWSEQ
jgi:YVTN family beta-propeller protein